MDPDFVHIIQVVVILGIIFIAVARAFLRIFVKPFLPPRQPGKPGEPRGQDLKEFLESLRGEPGPEGRAEPKAEGLLDADRGAVTARPAARPLEPPAAGRSDRPVPAPRPRPALTTRPLDRPPRPLVPATRPAAVPAATRGEIRIARSMAKAREVQRIEEQAMPEGVGEAGKFHTSTSSRLPATVLGTDLATAVVLTEVLGPPRCRRPWSRRI